MAVDEENAFLRKEFSDLQKKFKDKSQEVKVCWLVHSFMLLFLWSPTLSFVSLCGTESDKLGGKIALGPAVPYSFLTCKNSEKDTLKLRL